MQKVPADNKWYMRYVVRKIILSVLEGRYGPKISSSNRRKKHDFEELKAFLEKEIAEDK